jgi:hypothetical protein
MGGVAAMAWCELAAGVVFAAAAVWVVADALALAALSGPARTAEAAATAITRVE